MAAAQRLATKLRDRLGAEGVNLINACGPAAWQTIFHFHLHVVPRYRSDGLRPPWTPRSGDRGEIEAVASLLRVEERGYPLKKILRLPGWSGGERNSPI